MREAVMKPLGMDVHDIFVRRECMHTMREDQAIESRQGFVPRGDCEMMNRE